MSETRIPRTQTVMVAAVARLALGVLVIYSDRWSWDPTTRHFTRSSSFLFWASLMAAQTMLWTLAAPPLLLAFLGAVIGLAVLATAALRHVVLLKKSDADFTAESVVLYGFVLDPGDAPDAPQRGRVGQRVAVDEEEVRRSALTDAAGLGLAEDLARLPGDRGQAFPGLEARLDERLHLPGQLVGPARAAAEVGARP